MKQTINEIKKLNHECTVLTTKVNRLNDKKIRLVNSLFKKNKKINDWIKKVYSVIDASTDLTLLDGSEDCVGVRFTYDYNDTDAYELFSTHYGKLDELVVSFDDFTNYLHDKDIIVEKNCYLQSSIGVSFAIFNDTPDEGECVYYNATTGGEFTASGCESRDHALSMIADDMINNGVYDSLYSQSRYGDLTYLKDENKELLELINLKEGRKGLNRG